jgi:hypothetical protein
MVAFTGISSDSGTLGDCHLDEQLDEKDCPYVSTAARRACVTVAAGSLQKAGLISHSRAKVTVKNRGKLEDACCDCYGSPRNRRAKPTNA